ncbi:DUF6896 domain-containing protein [Fulvivirga kasyanovii]|uniref:DUF6896 domain-containing protein n=1 Tax=Fulvivirga kasyanovii TaxID=396812 RepID=UPI00162A8376|nr:hypothetical protein [Fulvivirga kasyanovii]
MDRKTDIIPIRTLEQVPSLESISAIPRESTLKLVFMSGLDDQREEIGKNLKMRLTGFQVGVHTIKPEINIAKLITDKEIEDNQSFFIECAKDYRLLGEELVFMLVHKLGINLNKSFPIETFNELKQDHRQSGKVGNWRYFVHGFHCGFKNIKTNQEIEVPLVFGPEFGELDPYFFTRYIKSTPKYNPLPVEIYEDYADGVRINEKMLKLGKFERIKSNVGDHYGIVVVDRGKAEIKSSKDVNEPQELRNKQNKKPKFSFWRFIGLKS